VETDVNSELLQEVLNCNKLPTLPAVAVRVIELTGTKDVSMRELADTIQNDQGLASKILKTVNSAFYGLSTPCSTISRAQLMLGLSAVKTLALGFTLVGTLKENEDDDFDYTDYWRRGVFTGAAAKSIASMLHCAEPEEAFLGGLLQDIGMLAMYFALGEEYLEVIEKTEGDHSKLAKLEREAFELHHPSVGEMLGERWKLPQALLAPIKFHERPTAAPKDFQDIVRCVGLGNYAAASLTAEDPTPWLTKFYTYAERWYSISRTGADDLLTNIVTSAREVSKLFDLKIGGYPDVSRMLEQANERLVDVMLEKDQELDRVVQQSEELKRALAVDAMTGVASRRQFLEELSAAYVHAHKNGETLHVALIDADNFRRVNDEFGREAGDAVIKGIAERLSEVVGKSRGSLARFGGEEFAILISGETRQRMDEIVTACQKTVKAGPFEVVNAEGVTVNADLTVSVGVATLDPSTAQVFSRLERLLNAADQAARAAKAAGGDCARVFSPRKKAAA
jgi:diguanylate cyclase (GGDEF)-like protein